MSRMHIFFAPCLLRSVLLRPLITAHNGPKVGAPARWAHLTTYLGGTSSSLQFVADGGGFRDAYFPGGGRRGSVTTFSRASRRRMFRFVGTINRRAYSRLPVLITLTYPGVYLQKPPEISRNLRAFLKRLRRRFGPFPVLWRLEYQRRGAPHFHLLLFDAPEDEDFEEFVADSWFEVVGTENEWHRSRGHDVRRATSWRGVLAYLAKYLAKPDGKDGSYAPYHGRAWGCECRSLLKTAPISFAVAVRDGLRARRWLLRLSGRRLKGAGPVGTMRVLCDSSVVVRMVEYLSPGGVSWPGIKIRAPGEVSRRAGGAGCCTDAFWRPVYP